MSLEDELKKAVEEGDLEEKLNDIIEEKVEERVQERLAGDKKQDQDSDKEEGGVSRRDFLKKLGAGAIGLGALSLSPASAFNIRSSDALEVYSNGSKYFDINPGGNVNITNADLDLNGNRIMGLEEIQQSSTGNPLRVQFKDSFNIYDDKTDLNDKLVVNAGGPVEVTNTNLALSGNDVHGVRQIDGSSGNHRIRFDSSSSWLEFTDQSNSRSDIVTNDVYLGSTSTGWLSGMEDHTQNSIDASTVGGKAASELGGGGSSSVWTTGFTKIGGSAASFWAGGATTSASSATTTVPGVDFSGPIRAKMYVHGKTDTYNSGYTAVGGGAVQIIDGNGVVTSINTRANTTGGVTTRKTTTVSVSVTRGQTLTGRLHATRLQTNGVKGSVYGRVSMSVTISVP